MTLHLPLYLVALLAINLLTFFMFWQDKRASRRGGWRVPEASLLLACLIGGSPAGYVAMRQFRHKTSKASFRLRYWLVVVLQLFFLAAWWLGWL